MRKGGALALLLLWVATPVAASGTLYLLDGATLYTVNTSTAEVSPVGPAFEDAVAPGESPGSFLYCADQTPALYSLPVDGSPQTLIANIDGDADRGLAYNSRTGDLFGTDNSEFGRIDRVTGDFFRLADPPVETECLAADPNRNLVYGLGTSDEELLVYDVVGNSWGIVGLTGVANGGKAGMAYDPTDDVIYVADRDGLGNLYSVDPLTAATVFIGETGVDSSFLGLAYVPDEVFLDDFESGDTSAWSNAVP